VSRTGRAASSACAQRIQGAFTAVLPGSASSLIAVIVSQSGDVAKRVAARSATPISSVIMI
jgi:hypothetical protein